MNVRAIGVPGPPSGGPLSGLAANYTTVSTPVCTNSSSIEGPLAGSAGAVGLATSNRGEGGPALQRESKDTRPAVPLPRHTSGRYVCCGGYGEHFLFCDEASS